MAQLLLGSLFFLLGYCVVPAPAPYCASGGYSNNWSCPEDYECCYSEANCCREDPEAEGGNPSYWYSWFLVLLIILICLCGCIGCGGYRRYYRSQYVVHRVQYPPPRATVATRATVAQPPPSSAAAAKPYSPYGIPKDPPPPYSLAVAPPPPYSSCKGQY